MVETPWSRRVAQRRRLGRGVRGRRSPARRTTRRATRSGRRCSRSCSTSTRPTTDDPDGRELRRRALAQNDELRRRVRPGLAADRAGRPRRRPVVGAGVPADVRALARRADEVPALQRAGPAGLDALPTCRCSTPRGSGSATPRRRGASRRREAALAAERDEMDRVVDHLIATDDSDLKVMSMLRGDDLRRRPGRRGAAADRRPRPARRAVRAHRRRRGAGADRRRVADAAAALPVAQLHHRRRPGAGAARVRRVVAGPARAGRARPRPARRR